MLRTEAGDADQISDVTTALMVLALAVVTVGTAHAAACDVTSTADQLGRSIDRIGTVANSSTPDARRSKKCTRSRPATEALDRASRTTPATIDDVRRFDLNAKRIVQAADRPWRYRMRSPPVVDAALPLGSGV
jgi:hypothetical protein